MNEDAARSTHGHQHPNPNPAEAQAEADAPRTLSWGGRPHNFDDDDSRTLQDFGFETPAPQQQSAKSEAFVSYTGYSDGTFEVTVSLGRGNYAATQSERGVAVDADDVRKAQAAAYTKAHQALSVIL